MFKVKKRTLLVIAGIVWFIAFFYTGLGCALSLAGVLFIRNYIVTRSNKS